MTVLIPKPTVRGVLAIGGAPALLFLAACSGAAGAGTMLPAPDPAARGLERPIPYPVPEPPELRRAVETGTRTRTGRPGPRYWQNWATYRIEASLDPATRRLAGRAWVRYENRSPDTLPNLFLYLNQNLFAPTALRNDSVPVTGGMTLSRVAAGGVELSPLPPGRRSSDLTRAGYVVRGTVLEVVPPHPVTPGAWIDLEFAWSFEVPPDGAPRGGTDGEVFFVSYWYPQFAVRDDFGRWQTDQYLGNAEFYMGYGDYDVSLTLPEGWLVGATGALQNPEAVLAAVVRERLAEARRSPGTVHVVAASDRGAGRATLRGADGRLTWRFLARNVRDFAFGASDRYLWDATSAVVGDATGDGRPDTAEIHILYRPERVRWAWDQSARYTQHSVEFLSRYLWPYPYPHMTAVDGPRSCGGMEYPMMTCIGGPRDTLRLYSVTVHETAHMWFPMQVGSDERRYAWQDEGLTRFNQAQGMREFFIGYDLERQVQQAYLDSVRRGGEVELMRHGDQYPVSHWAYGIASYQKMSSILRALRALLGEETFLRAYREYGRRWLFKHPSPYDFWNTFEEFAGRDLDWFWRSWFYETWTLDQAIAEVRTAGDSVEVVIEDRGLVPMPVRLAVTREGGAVERLVLGEEGWLSGSRRRVARLAGSPPITRVEIDPEHAFPDIDRSNQVWQR
jgi:hypothetical protein